MPKETNFQVGDSVTWLHQPRGGYGYVIPVNATVTRIGERQIQIRAERKDGGTKLTYVLPLNLRKRQDREHTAEL
jgi:hypothetical protein